MKRKYLAPILLSAVIMLAAVGCSSQKDEQTAPPVEEEIMDEADEQTEEAESAESADASEQSTITGTMDTIKDFMFILVDSEDHAYAISFEGEMPRGLDSVETGDKVIVTYTGEISEVDGFTGEVISVEKAE